MDFLKCSQNERKNCKGCVFIVVSLGPVIFNFIAEVE